MADKPLATWFDRNGKLLRLRLSRPKANLVDAEMIGALNDALAAHGSNQDLLAVLIDHEGPNFSFGASVEEHLPDQCAAMLKSMDDLVINILQSQVPVLVAVGGQCLGGGLEVACAGNFIFAGLDAQFGQPEIKVGVFAPAASCLLPAIIGQAKAEDLLYSGRSVSAVEAADMGLLHGVAENPEEAALAYFDEHLADKSASVLRHAVRAARAEYAEGVAVKLRALEDLYLQGLMETHDAVEGLQAFLEKRQAKWENR
ncbi:MAG: cyclohexa-1,5-dienecarbonyl-CoA hydratase [Rhodospirillaceae bacterium]|mgnify:CR=1 FL=1|jgi:cyclohexa-1,5-dienecarbonyl-CoA hydratase|nr:cyclohexa-1,5-dienecarbonyl-CoA hydratase [Rhodospirillaceae bacterium]MDP6644333.1 cyclohexa-1,5-dienecarbonyl-CoA hydratase [Rhodospirillales bacterium]|tara:strand:+ start:598 stop:1368 length:771 start_codon:yes stop_codon:yes gene_type:complete